jgi:hypothetical protein
MANIPETWFLVFAGATAVAVVLQLCLLIALAAFALQTRKQMQGLAKRVERDLLPIASSVRSLVEDTSPKVKLATDQLLEIVQTLRLQVLHVNQTLDQVVDKAQHQANRVDEIVTGVLDGVGHAAETLQRVVAVPARQFNGILSGLRVGFDVFRRKERETHSAADGENFI